MYGSSFSSNKNDKKNNLQGMTDALMDDYTLHLASGENGFFISRLHPESSKVHNYISDDVNSPSGLVGNPNVAVLRSLLNCNLQHGCDDNIRLPNSCTSETPFYHPYDPFVFGVLNRRSQKINPSPLLPKHLNNPYPSSEPYIPEFRKLKNPPDARKFNATVEIQRQPLTRHSKFMEFDKKSSLTMNRLPQCKTLSPCKPENPPRPQSRTPMTRRTLEEGRSGHSSRNTRTKSYERSPVNSSNELQSLYFPSRSLDLRLLRPVETERRETRLLLRTLKINFNEPSTSRVDSENYVPSCLTRREEVMRFVAMKRARVRNDSALKIQKAWHVFKHRMCRRDVSEVSDYAARCIQIAWRHYKSYTRVLHRLGSCFYTDESTRMCKCTRAVSKIQGVLRENKEYKKKLWKFGISRVENLLHDLLNGMRRKLENRAASLIQAFIRERLNLKIRLKIMNAAAKKIQKCWRKKKFYWNHYQRGVPGILKKDEIAIGNVNEYIFHFGKSSFIEKLQKERNTDINHGGIASFGTGPPWLRVAMWGSWMSWDNGMYCHSEKRRHFVRESNRMCMMMSLLEEYENVVGMAPNLSPAAFRKTVEVSWRFSETEGSHPLYYPGVPVRRDYVIAMEFARRVRAVKVAFGASRRNLSPDASKNDVTAECAKDNNEEMPFLQTSRLPSFHFVESMKKALFPFKKKKKPVKGLRGLSGLLAMSRKKNAPNAPNLPNSSNSLDAPSPPDPPPHLEPENPYVDKFGFCKNGFVARNLSSLYGSVVSPRRLRGVKYKSTLEQKVHRLFKAFIDVLTACITHAEELNDKKTPLDHPENSTEECLDQRKSLNSPQRRNVQNSNRNESPGEAKGRVKLEALDSTASALAKGLFSPRNSEIGEEIEFVEEKDVSVSEENQTLQLDFLDVLKNEIKEWVENFKGNYYLSYCPFEKLPSSEGTEKNEEKILSKRAEFQRLISQEVRRISYGHATIMGERLDEWIRRRESISTSEEVNIPAPKGIFVVPTTVTSSENVRRSNRNRKIIVRTRMRSMSCPPNFLSSAPTAPRPMLIAEVDCLGDAINMKSNCLMLHVGRRMQRWLTDRFERIVTRGNYRARVLKQLGDGGMAPTTRQTLGEDGENIRRMLWKDIQRFIISSTCFNAENKTNFLLKHEKLRKKSVGESLLFELPAEEGNPSENNKQSIPSPEIYRRSSVASSRMRKSIRSRSPSLSPSRTDFKTPPRHSPHCSASKSRSPPSTRSYKSYSLHNIQSPELPKPPPPERVWRGRRRFVMPTKLKTSKKSTNTFIF